MYQYPVRVRGKIYVWGSADLNVSLPLQLLLVISNNAQAYISASSKV